MPTLLSGIPAETSKGSGGIFTVYITEMANITGTTSLSNGQATIHFPAAVWKKYVLGKEAGSNFVSTYTNNIANGTGQYEQILTMVFKRNQVSKRNELKVLANSELVCVINDNCAPTGGTASCTVGNLYCIGLPICTNAGGAEVSQAVMATGAQMADANNMTVTIRVLETIPPCSIPEATYNAIVAGGAI